MDEQSKAGKPFTGEQKAELKKAIAKLKEIYLGNYPFFVGKWIYYNYTLILELKGNPSSF